MVWIATLLLNACVAFLLGCVAWGLSKRGLSQPWRHALWVLVLVKLVTPPIPVSLVAPVAGILTKLVAAPVWQTVVSGLLCVWIVGSFLMLLHRVAAFTHMCFSLRGAAHATNADAQRVAMMIARRIGLAFCPPLVLCDHCSPTLFGLPGSVVILFPRKVWSSIDPESRDALLAHELRHYSRGDHWVRLLETVSQILFWWCPIVWYAARQIELAEEDCCDSWVVHRFGAQPRRYAEGILSILQLAGEQKAEGGSEVCRWLHLLSPGSDISIDARFRQIMTGKALPAAPPSLALSLSAVAVAFVMSLLVSPASLDIRANQLAGRETQDRGATSAKTETERASRWWNLKPVRNRAVVDSPSGKYRLIADTSNLLTIQNLTNGAARPLTGQEVNCSAFLPNADQFIAGEVDGTVRVWRLATAEPALLVGQHLGAVLTIDVDHEGRRAVSGGEDGIVFVWDLQTGLVSSSWSGGDAPVKSVRFSPDGKRIVVVEDRRQGMVHGSRIVLLDANSFKELESRFIERATIVSAEFSDNENVFLADQNQQLMLWESGSSEVKPLSTLAPEQVSASEFSSDASLIFGSPQPAPGPMPFKFW
ncbi:MAG: M56 family metallopeptidase [Planctomycetaceae bacterium]